MHPFSNAESHAERIMVAASTSKVASLTHMGCIMIGKKVVDTSNRSATVEPVQSVLERLNRLGLEVGIEVSSQHNQITIFRMVCNQSQNVVCSGTSTADSASRNGKGPMVVHNEQRFGVCRWRRRTH